MLFRISIYIVCYALLSSVANAEQEGYFSVVSREGVKQPFWLIEPDNATQCVILFPGGNGNIDIEKSGIGIQGNFLVRTRNQFAKRGMVVAVVDVPSDKDKLFRFRKTAEHARDIQAVMAFIQQRHPNKPLWLVGTSRGTISAANVAARVQGNQGPHGIVLTSSVTKKSKKNLDSLEDVDLASITVPTLVVHHKDDECKVTPFDGAEGLLAELSAVKVKEFKSVSGGESPGKPCKGKSYHGFLGIEDNVVKLITDWIKAH